MPLTPHLHTYCIQSSLFTDDNEIDIEVVNPGFQVIMTLNCKISIAIILFVKLNEIVNVM